MAVSSKSMFGNHFKFILILTALAWMTYSLPSVKEAMGDTTGMADPSSEVAASFLSIFRTADTATATPPRSAFVPASSTDLARPIGAPQPLMPQEVVSLLAKLGLIDPSKVADARKAVELYSRTRMNNGVRQNVTSDGDVRGDNATITPPRYPVPLNASGTMRQLPPGTQVRSSGDNGVQ